MMPTMMLGKRVSKKSPVSTQAPDWAIKLTRERAQGPPS